MAHPLDSEIYPEGTVVRLKKNGKIAVIKDQTFLMDGKNFLHYLGEIEGQKGRYCLLHDDIEVIKD